MIDWGDFLFFTSLMKNRKTLIMKKFLLIFTLLSFVSVIFGQVAINQDGSEPAPGAALHVKGAGGDFFIEDATANVGIGTITPGVSLHISNGDPVIRLQDDVAGNAAAAIIEFGGSGGGAFESVGSIGDFVGAQYLGINASSSFDLKVNGHNTIRVNPSGDVAIGTLSAMEQLHVKGNVYVEDGKVMRNTTTTTDLLPIAYGVVDLNGNILSGSGNFTVNHIGTGDYRIAIQGEAYSSDTYTCVAMPRNTINLMLLSMGDKNDELRIRTWFKSGSAADNTFHFVVYKP